MIGKAFYKTVRSPTVLSTLRISSPITGFYVPAPSDAVSLPKLSLLLLMIDLVLDSTLLLLETGYC
jgi:hypothetical protein